jgi:subtilisin family serine protease
MKIGIIDDGVDQSHPFFDPDGYSYPPGFPKGNREFTTPKVIVARAFAPPTTTWKHARLPFDPEESEHGTHVAGIAAGNQLAAPVQGRGNVSGQLRAYIGNYKAPARRARSLTDNAAEVVAAIGPLSAMDVINMSLAFELTVAQPGRWAANSSRRRRRAVAAAGNSLTSSGAPDRLPAIPATLPA